MPAAVARLYLAAWIACHLLYPLWYPLSGSLGAGVALFSALAAVAAAMTVYLRPALLREPAGSARPALPRDGFLWALFACVVLLRIYPLSLPTDIFVVGDEMAHMAFPALPFKVWARALPVPFWAVFWGAAAAAWAFRGRLRRAARAFRDSLLAGRPGACLGAGLAAAAYFAVLFYAIRRFSQDGHESLARDLLRFPPLTKFPRMLCYAAFGVSDLSGRLPEFAAFLGTGLLLYRLSASDGETAKARAAAAVYWLMPVCAYYSLRGTQSNGEVFFYTLTFYFYARWDREDRLDFLYWAALASSMGILYRYTAVPSAIILAAMTAMSAATRRARLPLKAALECAGMLALAALPWVGAFYWYKQRVYTAPLLSAAESLAIVGRSLPGGASWPVLALGFLGLAAARPGKAGLSRVYLLVWFLFYYVFISFDRAIETEFFRFSLPLYPVLALWAASGLTRLSKGPAAAAALAGFLLLVTTVVPMAHIPPEFRLWHGLQTEYAPLPQAARYLESLPEGTRLLAVDCGPGCYTMYLPRPRALSWTEVSSRALGSLDALRRACAEEGAQTVIFTVYPPLPPIHPGSDLSLLAEFENDAPDFKQRAFFRFGRNKILLKDCPRAAAANLDKTDNPD